MADDDKLDDGPLPDRLESAKWKVRKAAYEELEQKFKESLDNRIFEEYGPKFKKIVADKNAAAQEKGLEALAVWIDRAENPTRLNSLCPVLVDKCFSGRPKTKEKAIECLLLFVEVDETAETVANALLEGANHKVAKIASLCLTTLKRVLQEFGTKIVPIKPIVKQLPKYFEHSDKVFREEAQALVVEIYRWVGAAIKSQLDSLRPAQLKDLETAFEALPKQKATPLKYVRSQQPEEETEETGGGTGGASSSQRGAEEDEEEDGEMDPYDLAEPAEVLSQINGAWFEGLESSKWKDRKEQMEKLVTLVDKPRLKPGDYREVASALKKAITKDANIIVATLAIKAAGLLARGLRQDFAMHGKMLLSPLLAKFKEKKANVVEGIHEALGHMMNTCFSLTEVVDDVLDAMKDKLAQIKQQTLVFVIAFMQKSKRATVGQIIKTLGPVFIATLEDASPEVREAAYKAFGALVGKVGERPVAPLVAKLDPAKEKKIREYYPEKIPTAPLPSENRSKATKGNATASSKSTKAAPRAKAAPKSSAPNTTNAATPAPKPAAPAPKPKPKKVEPVPLMPPEEALAKAVEEFPAEVLVLLGDASWKQRLAGMEAFSQAAEQLIQQKKGRATLEIIFRKLEHQPGWNESNFQVASAMYTLLDKLAGSPFFDGFLAQVAVAPLVPKIPELKLRRHVTQCLGTISEAVGLPYVLLQIYKHSTDSKNPKVLTESLLWVTTAIEEFGMKDVDVKALVDWAKSSLESSNAMTRSNGVKLFGKLYVYIGESIQEHLANVKPALLTTIQKEFERVATAKPEPPTRFKREVPQEEVATQEEPEATADDVPQVKVTPSRHVSPREPPKDDGPQDVSAKLTTQLIANLSHADWKVRKTALDEVEKILKEANMKIQCAKGLDSLVQILKVRLKDSNGNVALLATKLVGSMATAAGAPFERYLKFLAPTIFSLLTDSRKALRDYAIASLDAWSAAVGIDAFVPYLVDAIAVNSPTSRKESLGWFIKYRANLSKDVDTQPLVKPAIQALLDRNVEVRQLAETALADLIPKTPTATLQAALVGLPPASKKDVQTVLKRYLAPPVSDTAATSSGSLARAVKTSLAQQQQGRGRSTGTLQPRAIERGRSRPGTPGGSSTPGSRTSSRPSSRAGSRAGSRASSPSPTRRSSAARTPGSAKQTTTSASRSSSGAVKRVAANLPLSKNDDKEMRAQMDERLDGGHWRFKVPTPEHLQFLADQMKPCVSAELHGLLFSKDFRQHREAIRLLETYLQQYFAETYCNLDVILKWCTLRFFDTNTTTQGKTLAYLLQLLEALDQNDCRLSDYEASVLLPALIELAGQGETHAQPIRELFKVIPRVYPASKLLDYLVDAIASSKSPRSRAECLQQMASLVRRQGLTACSSPSTVLPTVLRFVTDKVAPVRQAALAFMQQAHLHVGDDIWAYLGSVTETQKALIIQTLGTDAPPSPAPATSVSRLFEAAASPDVPLSTTKTASSQRIAASVPRTQSTPNMKHVETNSGLTPSKPTPQKKSFSLGLDELEPTTVAAPAPKKSIEMPALASTTLSSEFSDMPTPSLPSRFVAKTQPSSVQKETKTEAASPAADSDQSKSSVRTIINSWSQLIMSGDANAIVSTTMLIGKKVEENQAPFIGTSDALVQAMHIQLQKNLSSQTTLTRDTNRQCKYILNALLKIFQHSSIASVLSLQSIKPLLQLLLESMLDSRVPEQEKGAIYKGIQTLVAKMLRNSDQTVMFATLLQSLSQSLSEPGNYPKTIPQIITKGLLKVTQVLKTTIDNIDLDQLLYEIHCFLQLHAHHQEYSKLIRSLLKEIVNLKGRTVSNHLSRVPVRQYPTPHLVSILNDLQKEQYGMEAPSPSSLPGEATNQAKLELASIFRLLGQKDRVEEGLQKLYQYKQDHPDIDIQPHLSEATPQFQAYIRTGLCKLAEKNQDPQQENKDPMLTGDSLKHKEDGSSYMEKLRSLQKKYGLSTRPAASSATSVIAPLQPANGATKSSILSAPSATTTNQTSDAISSIRQRLQQATQSTSLRSTAGSQLDIAQGISSTTPSSFSTAAPSTSATTSDSISHLRSRLESIKKGALSNSPSSNTLSSTPS